mgnify:CR=1 FL=1
MIRRPPRSTLDRSSAASDVYKRQAFILSFIGIKMIISPFYHIESVYSLMVIGGILMLSVIASIMFPNKQEVEN